jgi:PTH1 family peptidyl-tRNA hydrolase
VPPGGIGRCTQGPSTAARTGLVVRGGGNSLHAMTTSIRLVAGLGNIGREYASTRHNAGFWFADALAAMLGATFARESKFAGEVTKTGALRIVKPTTYMNLSGQSVAALANFLAIAPEEILVVHDELDLEPGAAKMKLGGGVAGHNGLKDIRDKLGSAQFWRLRLGIGHPRDSVFPEQAVVDYVLRPPPAAERAAIDDAIRLALERWPDIAGGDFERAMMVLHTKPKEEK